jgi:predicted metal-dependent RNase
MSGPLILVTVGGMCDGGPILSCFDSLLRKASTTVLFTGYLSGGTLGAKLARMIDMPRQDRLRLSESLEWPAMDPGGR